MNRIEAGHGEASQVEGQGSGVSVSLENPLRFRHPVTLLFFFASLIALYVGWQIRREYLITAEYGLGYALGIIGGSMMLVLLIYPLKKRFYDNSLLILSTKNWFKLHMALGVIGPLLVLYHCNFSLGSTNSNIALASMLLMVVSGLVGRFVYGKIHYGLYGSKIELRELRAQHLVTQKQLDDDRQEQTIFISEKLTGKLRAFEQAVLKPRGLFGNFLGILMLGVSTRLGYLNLLRCLKKDQRQNREFNQLSRADKRRHFQLTRAHIVAYLSTIRRIAGLSFYEHFFSLWHMLHVPIFFMLLITSFVHVYAVHAY